MTDKVIMPLYSPKDGAGDSECNNVQLKRIPVPSCRKFSARAPPLDENIKRKLKKAIFELEGEKPRLKGKSKTVAEIQPTKCKPKRRSVGANSRDEVSVHVTPRPFEDEAPSASLRGAVDKSVACKFYQRLLLNAWRRSRYQLTTITESFNRQKEQINNLEMQITLLKKLNRSEIQKRDEALLEFQNTKSTLERIQHDNVNLCKNLESFKLGLDNNQKTLKNAEVEIKTFSEKLRSTEMELKEKSKENIKLTKKVDAKGMLIKTINLKMEQLENSLNLTTNNLKNTKNIYDEKQLEYEDLLCQLDTKTSESAFLEEQLELYKSQNLRLEQHVEVLQEELSDHISRLELIRMENETMKTDIEDVTCELNVEKETSWWKSTKQLANLSVTALETAAHIMLPAYLD